MMWHSLQNFFCQAFGMMRRRRVRRATIPEAVLTDRMWNTVKIMFRNMAKKWTMAMRKMRVYRR